MTSDDNEHRAGLTKQGLALMNSRRLDEAKALFVELSNQYPDDADAWYMLSSINGMLGRIDEAGECCRRVLALQPDRAEAHVNLGNVLLGQGKLDEAAASYQTALQLKPDLSVAHFSLGNLLMRQEQYDKAADSYCRAVALNPIDAQINPVRKKGRILMQLNRLEEAKVLFDCLCRVNPADAEAWYNLSIIHGSLGDIEETGESCRRVLEIQPDHSGAHANLGNVFFHHRQFDEAITQYEKALELDPRNVTALHNMGKACQTEDDIGRYIEHYRRVIALAPNPAEARATFSDVMSYTFSFPAEYLPWLDEELQECFSVAGIDHQPLGLIAARLLKFKYSIPSPIDGGDEYVRTMSERIALDKLFLMTLEKAVNADADIELLLTRVRRALLLAYCREKRLGISQAGLVLALAYQGVNNEYVFAVDAEETHQIDDLRREIERCSPSLTASNEDLEGKLLVFGMYDRVSSLSCMEDLCRLPLTAWSQTFLPFVTEALLNPREEERIKDEIISLGGIADQTSQLVRSQYEENPYPRWVVVGKKNKVKIRQGLQSTFPHLVPPPFLDGPVQMLVAGCGTGKQPIQAALSYNDVEILAVDISKSSLAYAARMARKYEVENIEFMQGDILELAGLNRRFHIIECIGVLHHMEDPLAGWKVLAGLLVEDGLMQIGLYSESARHAVVEAREIIKNEALASDKDAIRNFRARVFRRELGDNLYAMARNSPDFFSTSGCRDLLFHFQEHRYTLTQLRRELDEMKLDFIGFKRFRNLDTANLYRSHFPEDRGMKNLDLWDRFEKLYPYTFGEMYHFWCQKKSSDA